MDDQFKTMLRCLYSPSVVSTRQWPQLVLFRGRLVVPVEVVNQQLILWIGVFRTLVVDSVANALIQVEKLIAGLEQTSYVHQVLGSKRILAEEEGGHFLIQLMHDELPQWFGFHGHAMETVKSLGTLATRTMINPKDELVRTLLELGQEQRRLVDTMSQKTSYFEHTVLVT